MKNVLGISILVVLLLVAYFAINENTGSANNEVAVYEDFAIEDTASVDQIFMSHQNGAKILLSRRDSKEWLVNGEFPARKDAINLIMKTLHDIEVKTPVSAATFEGVVKRLSGRSIKVEFYKGEDEPEKVWYIGHPTANRTGTYMLLEKGGRKSEKPFVTHMMTERGYLGTRFFLQAQLWKNPLALKSNPLEIKSIEVNHYNDSLTSFKVDKMNPEKFNITNKETDETTSLDPRLGISYFEQFDIVFYEYVDLKTPIEILDSIYAEQPRHQIKLTTSGGKEIILKTFNLPVPENTMMEGNTIYHNPERMYLYSSFAGSDLHPIVQNLTFDPLVPTFEDFKPLTTVEK